MNILVTESQYKYLTENLDQILDLYSKMNKGEELKPSEKDKIRAFKKFTERGGNADDFIFDMDDVYDTDDREGTIFKYKLKGNPFSFEFSEEIKKLDQIEYYGEIKYDNDEYLGVIVTDRRGYILYYDFYSTLMDEDVRLQDKLKKEGNDFEIKNFFQEKVIKDLRS